MQVLVTGGAGFIGSHLVEALVKRGHQVRVLDDLSEGTFQNLQAVRKKIQFIKEDICKPTTLERAIRGVDLIFHQAARRSVPKSVTRPLLYHAVNVSATLNLLNLAVKYRVRRVVCASSSSIFGEPDGSQRPTPQKETLAPAPQSPYAATKLCDEVYCGMFTRLHGLSTVCLRYFNVFGPRQSLENQYAVVVPKFITSLLTDQSPPIHGNGSQSRDFTYVGNVVQANLKAAFAKRAKGEVFNIASGGRHSVLELVRVLNKIIGTNIDPYFTPVRQGDVMHTWADISKAKRLLGYRPSVSFEEGLRRTVTWFEQHPEFWKKPLKKHPQSRKQIILH